MKPKQLDALENALDTLSTCLRDARNINHELPEFIRENMDNLPKIKIFPEQDIVEVLKETGEKTVSIVVRLQAMYFAVHSVVKKERRASNETKGDNQRGEKVMDKKHIYPENDVRCALSVALRDARSAFVTINELLNNKAITLPIMVRLRVKRLAATSHNSMEDINLLLHELKDLAEYTVNTEEEK